MTKLQMAMFPPKSDWVPPVELPDIFDADEIAIDVETRDPNLKQKGPGWPTKDGEVVGYAIAVGGWKCYIPVGHAGGGAAVVGEVPRDVLVEPCVVRGRAVGGPPPNERQGEGKHRK